MKNAQGVCFRLFTIVIAAFFLGNAGENAVKVVTPKKGIAMASFGPGNAATAGASWYYDWNNNPHSGSIPAGLTAPEFVPMLWGASNVTDQNIATLTTAKNNGAYKHLLGFNEPDQAGQANMTVAQAISLWPKLMSTGLLLGSPAPASTGAWLNDFMSQVTSLNYRVDFICLHTYRPPAASGVVDGIKTWVTGVYNQFKKPIWLTEFGAPDCNKLGWCGSASPLTQAQVDTYTAQVIAMLEDCPFVERYAWFVDASQSGFELSAIFKSDGTLSQTGIDFRDAQGSSIVYTRPKGSNGIAASQVFFGKAGGALVFKLPPNQSAYHVSIYTLSGKCLCDVRGSGSGNIAIHSLNTGLAKGVYIGNLDINGRQSQTRFTVE